ncbi:hypothetical protein E4T48_04255 [Aureobasidium sp. EXF-10727]|nr:hypothetical protein E4T48_04255 [Aureobasidium sp. EXF-10727]
MAPKRPLDSDGSAKSGAKKPRIESDGDGDVEMADELSAFADQYEIDDEPFLVSSKEEVVDETMIPPIRLDDLDYDNGDFPDDIVYDDYGTVHSGYYNPIAPSYPMPKSSDMTSRASPSEISFPASMISRVKKAVLKFPKLLIPQIIKSTPEKHEVLELFEGVKRLDGGWIGVEGKLGKGGQGCARLFVKVDDQRRITQRVVIKDSWQPITMWTHESWWEKGRLGCDPRESIVNKLLSLPTPERWERYIVEYLAHSINHTWQVNRTYMEYCDGGDLHKLMTAQKKAYRHPNPNYASGAESGDDSPKWIDSEAGTRVPEPFVWYYLKQMAVALHRMNNIPLRRYKGNYEVVHHYEWQWVESTDSTLVFLAKPDPEDFPKYPVCKISHHAAKIGDFGSSYVTFPLDPENPVGFFDAVTAGYIAPEMDETVTGREAWPLTSATNVWQIAMTAVTLMRLENPEAINYEEKGWDKEFTHTLGDLQFDYSSELTDLLEAMLSNKPASRPTPKDILEWLFDENVQPRWRTMATAPECNDPDLSSSWLHWSPNEKNQINDFFDDVPSLPKKKKTKIGGLPVPDSSSDDDDDDDDDDEEEEDNDVGLIKAKGKNLLGVVMADSDDDDEDLPGADEDDFGSEEEEEDEDEVEDEVDGIEDLDPDFDDPMAGSSGPSLSSGSPYNPSRRR